MNYTANKIAMSLKAIGSAAYSHVNTLHNSYNSAEYCIKNNIEGDFVECGVAAGSQIAAMALAAQVHGVARNIWAFDSFQGIPLADPEHDTSQPGKNYFKGDEPKVENKRDLLVSSKITVHSLENVKNNLGNWGIDGANFKFVPGWFQDTVADYALQIDKIAILRLDGDLYHSTVVCLEHLFPKLVSGGILIIDDWALEGCRKACNEYFKKLGGYGKNLSNMHEIEGTTPVWFIKK